MATEIKVNINAKGVITGGKEVEGGLQKIRQQAKQTQVDLQKAVQVDVKSSLPQLSQFGGGLKNISSGLGLIGKAGIAGAVLAGFANFALDAAEASERLNNSLLGLRTVAKNTGNDLELATSIAKNLSKDGLIPLEDSAAALKNLLSTGLDAEKAGKLLLSLKDAAAFNRQGFLTMGEAVKSATEGIKNGNSILVDNAGITKNLSILQKEYAAEIGKTVGQLSDAEKIQAAYVGILREAEKFTGDAAKAADTYTGAKARLSTSIDRATASLGSFITQSTFVKGSLSLIADAIDNLSFSSKSASEKIDILKEDLKNFVPGLDLRAPERKKFLIDEIAYLEEVAALEKIRGAQGEYEARQKRELIDLTKQQEEATRKAADVESKRLKEVEKLKKSLIDSGKTELEKLKDIKERRLELAKGDADARLLIEKDYQDKVTALREKSQKKETKDLKDLTKLKREAFDALTDGASNPFGNSKKSEQIKNDPKLSKEFDNRRLLGQGVGLANAVVGGKEGAQQLVSGIASLGLDAIVPGLGQAAKPLLDAFTQGPEAVKAMVKEFTGALPDIVVGFVEAIPVFITTLIEEIPVVIEKLAEAAPEIIQKLADAAPEIITRLVENAPKIIATLVKHAPKIAFALQTAMPKAALGFANDLIKNIPRIVSEAARAIYNALVRILSDLNPFGGGNGFFSGSADKGFLGTGIKFARGGEVPSSAGVAFRDSVDATLMGGERVLDRETNSKFKKFVNEGGSGSSEILLARIISLLEAPMTVNSSVNVNNKNFADILLQLSRTNQRTS